MFLDIDECDGPTPISCDNGKSCINTRGGFQCVCNDTQYGPECQYSKLKELRHACAHGKCSMKSIHFNCLFIVDKRVNLFSYYYSLM